MDVTDAAGVQAAFAAAEAWAGRIDILVNNSGVAPAGPGIDLDEADWDRTLDTNLKGAWLVSRAFARSARTAKRSGAIVNVASILGSRVAGHVAAYAASKAGLIQLTKARRSNPPASAFGSTRWPRFTSRPISTERSSRASPARR